MSYVLAVVYFQGKEALKIFVLLDLKARSFSSRSFRMAFVTRAFFQTHDVGPVILHVMIYVNSGLEGDGPVIALQAGVDEIPIVRVSIEIYYILTSDTNENALVIIGFDDIRP